MPKKSPPSMHPAHSMPDGRRGRSEAALGCIWGAIGRSPGAREPHACRVLRPCGGLGLGLGLESRAPDAGGRACAGRLGARLGGRGARPPGSPWWCVSRGTEGTEERATPERRGAWHACAYVRRERVPFTGSTHSAHPRSGKTFETQRLPSTAHAIQSLCDIQTLRTIPRPSHPRHVRLQA
jgi:hypothetical protein